MFLVLLKIGTLYSNIYSSIDIDIDIDIDIETRVECEKPTPATHVRSGAGRRPSSSFHHFFHSFGGIRRAGRAVLRHKSRLGGPPSPAPRFST